jgi:hypothetical protein
MSIRLSRGEPAHLPPASRLRCLNRSVTEIRPKSIGGSIMSRTVSVESVPVKLDTRPFQPNYVVLSPLQEVYSPAVSERIIIHGEDNTSPRSATFSERLSRGSIVHTHELRRISSNGSERPIYAPVCPLSPMNSRLPTSPTISERMENRGAKSWYNESEDTP